MEAQGPRFTSDCSRGIYERERKGGKAEAVRWFLKQPEALAPPSPAKEGGTFVASAFLERSCDFSGLGTEGYA